MHLQGSGWGTIIIQEFRRMSRAQIWHALDRISPLINIYFHFGQKKKSGVNPTTPPAVLPFHFHQLQNILLLSNVVVSDETTNPLNSYTHIGLFPGLSVQWVDEEPNWRWQPTGEGKLSVLRLICRLRHFSVLAFLDGKSTFQISYLGMLKF